MVNDDPVVVRLYFRWHEVLGLYDELNNATEAHTVVGEKTDEKGFWLFGDNRCYLTANTADEAHKDAERKSVNASDYDPIQKIDDSNYWENPLFPITKDDSPVFIDAYALLKAAQSPPEPDAQPKYLCVDLRKRSIYPWLMFSEKEGRVIYLKP